MGENTHQNCTRQNKNKEDPGRQQPCWGFLFCTNLTQPTGALDADMAEEIMQIFQEIHAQGKTVVIVTHDDKIAAKTNRLIRLEKGTIVEDKPLAGERGTL